MKKFFNRVAIFFLLVFCLGTMFSCKSGDVPQLSDPWQGSSPSSEVEGEESNGGGKENEGGIWTGIRNPKE